MSEQKTWAGDIPRRFLAIAVISLLVLCTLPAEGNELGAIQIKDGVKEVNFNMDKGFRFSAAGRTFGLVEVRTTFTNNASKRASLFYAGSVSLKAPLPVEVVQALGGVWLLLLLSAITVALRSAFHSNRAELRRES
ncbi:MAG TPA: hypothetical protein VN673_03335 [Clostridia bacterium]|nr:hypothetical protein [Clostridia bacterium]